MRIILQGPGRQLFLVTPGAERVQSGGMAGALISVISVSRVLACGRWSRPALAISQADIKTKVEVQGVTIWESTF